MSRSSCTFYETSSNDSELLSESHAEVNSPTSQRNAPISFEDLGIPRIVSVRPTIIGHIRTVQNLGTLDWFLLIGGILSVVVTFGLAIDRFILLQPKSPDYMFAILLLYNGVFSALYIVNTVYKEQAYEGLAYALTSIVVNVYITINYLHNGDDPDKYVFQLVRLILSLFLGGVMGLTAVIVSFQQLQSQNLLSRTVGTDSTIQAMCKKLFTTITLIHFDVQIVGSFIILLMEHGFGALSLKEILIIIISMVWTFGWALICYFAIRLENAYLFSISMVSSFGHFVFIIYYIVMAILKEKKGAGEYYKYAAGGLGILIHIVLIVYMTLCYKNFGKGLKEKVFPSSRRAVERQRMLNE